MKNDTRADAPLPRRMLLTALSLLSWTLAPAVQAQQATTPAAAPATTPAPAAGGGSSTSLGARLDCLHDFSRDKGAAQDCLTLTGLRIGLTHRVDQAVVAAVRLDPFATPVGGRRETPFRQDLPGPDDTELGVVDDYSVIWMPRPNLEIAVESYEGAAKIPSMSGLALANSFALTGWKQTAVSVTYNLQVLPDMRVKFAVGNGEGEDGRNLDPQQYFGFEAGASIVKGVGVSLGVSLDGNSAGSAERLFVDKRYQDECGIDLLTDVSNVGHSTQRIAAGVALDGTLAGVEDLKAGIGWQRNVLSDLSKGRRSAPTAADFDGATPGCHFNPDTPFVEADPDTVNTVQMTTYGVSLAYKILSSYFLGLDFTTRNIDTGSSNVFRTCGAYSDGVCRTASADAGNKLGQSAFTVGAGMELSPDLLMTLEYHETSYDKKYALAYYPSPEGKTSDRLDLFNVRIAYNWK